MGTVTISVYDSLSVSEGVPPPSIKGIVAGHTGWMFQDYAFTMTGTGVSSPLLGEGGTGELPYAFEMDGDGEQGEYGTGEIPAIVGWTFSGTGLTGHAMSVDAEYSFSLDGTLVNGYLGTGSITIKGWEMEAEGGGYSISLTYPSFSMSGTGLTGDIGTADLTYSFETFTSTGAENQTGTGAISFPPYSISVTLPHGKNITGAITFPGWIVSADGVAGSVGTGAWTLEGFSISVTINVSGTGTGTVIWPAFLMEASGLVDIIADLAAATAAYTTYALNSANFAPTLYSSFGFNSYAKIGSSYYGANSSGIFKLEGATDGPSATEIDVTIEQQRIDGKNNKLKRPLESYFGLRSSGHFNVEITLDEKTNIYPVEDYDTNPHTVRAKFGKGARGRYVGVKITNIDGSDLQIGDIEIPIAELGRKDR